MRNITHQLLVLVKKSMGSKNLGQTLISFVNPVNRFLAATFSSIYFKSNRLLNRLKWYKKLKCLPRYTRHLLVNTSKKVFNCTEYQFRDSIKKDFLHVSLDSFTHYYYCHFQQWSFSVLFTSALSLSVLSLRLNLSFFSLSLLRRLSLPLSLPPLATKLSVARKFEEIVAKF